MPPVVVFDAPLFRVTDERRSRGVGEPPGYYPECDIYIYMDTGGASYTCIAFATTRRFVGRVTYETASNPSNVTGIRTRAPSPAR